MNNCLEGSEGTFLAWPPALSSIFSCLFEFISPLLFVILLKLNQEVYVWSENKTQLKPDGEKYTQVKAHALKKKVQFFKCDSKNFKRCLPCLFSNA